MSWDTGVETYDCVSKERFNMRVTLIETSFRQSKVVVLNNCPDVESYLEEVNIILLMLFFINKLIDYNSKCFVCSKHKQILQQQSTSLNSNFDELQQSAFPT